MSSVTRFLLYVRFECFKSFCHGDSTMAHVKKNNSKINQLSIGTKKHNGSVSRIRHTWRCTGTIVPSAKASVSPRIGHAKKSFCLYLSKTLLQTMIFSPKLDLSKQALRQYKWGIEVGVKPLSGWCNDLSIYTKSNNLQNMCTDNEAWI